MQHCGGGSFKSQMKKADASGAALAVIVGDDEAARRRGEREAAARRTREQLRVPLDRLPAVLTDMIYAEESEWPPTISKNRNSSPHSRRGGSSTAT